MWYFSPCVDTAAALALSAPPRTVGANAYAPAAAEDVSGAIGSSHSVLDCRPRLAAGVVVDAVGTGSVLARDRVGVGGDGSASCVGAYSE